MAEQVNFFWVGSHFAELNSACVRSFLRNGHRVVFHAFERPKELPSEAEFIDARELMRQEEIVAYRSNGSFALTANIYRLRIQKAGLGLYVDTDMFCLKPLPDDEYLFGWETSSSINNAVLRLPAESKLLKDLMEMVEDPYVIPFWEKRTKRLGWQTRKWLGFPKHVSSRRWGVIGPKALTHCILRLGMEHMAAPIDHFYPLHWDHRPLLHDPGVKLEELASSRSYAIHLCASGIKTPHIVPGSPLDQMIKS